MGLFDRSSSSTTNLTENINAPNTISDSEGAVIGGGDVYVVNTDHNAFEEASGLARRSLDVGESLSLETLNVAERVALLGNDLTERLTLGAFDFAGELGQGSREQAADVLSQGLDFTRTLQDKFQNTVASTVDAIQRIGIQQNKSTDERLADTTETTLRYALIGLGVMAAGLVAFAAFRR